MSSNVPGSSPGNVQYLITFKKSEHTSEEELKKDMDDVKHMIEERGGNVVHEYLLFHILSANVSDSLFGMSY
jgi:hypothetical protein